MIRVYAASVDIRKAFDKVSHCKLLNILVDTGLPHVLIRVISNWYSNLYVAVRWKGVMLYPQVFMFVAVCDKVAPCLHPFLMYSLICLLYV